jgi:guanyl-specific ribonuclease Sa
VTIRAGRLTEVTTRERLQETSGMTRRLLVVVVGFVLAVLGLALSAGPAAAQDRVGAQPGVMILSVGPHDAAAPGTVGVRGPPLHQLVSATGVAAETAAGEARIAFGPAPENAWSTFDRVSSKGSPLPGYKGGGGFANDGRNGSMVLPRTTSGGDVITYREWDINPYVKGVDRGSQRIVTGSVNGQIVSGYYTGDHYITFTQFAGG